jgi:hypothetical protein
MLDPMNSDVQSLRIAALWFSGRTKSKYEPYDNQLIPKLRKTPQAPLAYRGAIPDSDRAKKPRLDEPTAPKHELNPGDRVEGLGDFGKPTGKFGTVTQVNEDDAVVKWDGDGRQRLCQSWLRKE